MRTPATASHGAQPAAADETCPASSAPPNSMSLLQNPLSGGTPARASIEITRPSDVIGMRRPRPRSLSRCVTARAAAMPASAMNAAPFMTAWLSTCSIAPAIPTPE